MGCWNNLKNSFPTGKIHMNAMPEQQDSFKKVMYFIVSVEQCHYPLPMADKHGLLIPGHCNIVI